MLRVSPIELFFLVAFFVSANNVFAGDFKVNPTSVTFSDNERSSSITLTNNGTDTLTVQIETKEWIISDSNMDQYLPTKNLIVFPKIISIPSGEKALVRIGHQKQKPAIEKSYRVFMRELPVNKAGDLGLKMALTLSIPVFIEPEAPTQLWALAQASIRNGAINVSVQNSGNVHLINSKIVVKSEDDDSQTIFNDEKSGWYILAGTTRDYIVPFPMNICLRSKSITVSVYDKNKDHRNVSLPVENELCSEALNVENKLNKKK